jgi:GT2 family glycosyltransferase
VLALDRNYGFGGGSNAGFRAAKNDVVVLLNSDMRVAPDFLAPLLEGFGDDRVFAVSCQIFFRDPNKPREETGLTEGWWQDGGLKVGHRIDAALSDVFPCFYGGGGSCAFDRRKFLELGGFDDLLAPFYLEDTDLGYMAWKRGWKVLYQPRSIVYHEHRGTIGKRFSEAQIQAVLKKNYLLFCWKNIHEWPRLASHFFFSYGGALLSLAGGYAGPRESGWLVARISATSRRRRLALAGARLRHGERYRSVPQAAGGVLPGPLSRLAGDGRSFAGAFCFTLSDLSAGAWRRRVHVSDLARARQAVRGARGGAARGARAGSGAGGAAGLLRVRRVSGAPGGSRGQSGIDRPVRRPRVRQQRAGLADSPAALSEADRRAAARVHAARPVCGAISEHPADAV